MCGYITYEQYKALGERLSNRPSPCWKDWRVKSWTTGRRGRIAEVDDDIRLCMLLLIDAMGKIKSGKKDVSSVSNDGVSVTYASAQTEEQLMGSVYDQVVEILPVELVNLEVGS